MNNRTFRFRSFAHHTLIIVAVCLTVQLIARFVWATIITFGSVLPALLTAGSFMPDLGSFWHLFSEYTSDFAMLFLTQSIGVLIVAAAWAFIVRR